jgi:hypothetical protein
MFGDEKFNRRTALKAGVAGFTAAMTASVPTVAKGSGERTVVLKGTPNNPVTPPQAQTKVSRLLETVSLESEDEVLYALPDVPSDEYYTASYVVKIGEDGVPITHVNYGKPGEKGDFRADLHRLAERRRTEMEQSDTFEDYQSQRSPRIESDGSSEGDVGTESYSGSNVTFDDAWNKFSVTDAFAEGDNGEVSVYGRHAHMKESAEDSTSYDQWGASINYRSTPSSNNGKQEIDSTEFRQDWSEGNHLVKNDHVYDSSPSGEIDGQHSFGAEVSGSVGSDTSVGASISWSYTQPEVGMTERTDQNGNEGDAVWKYDCETEVDHYDTTLDVTCGSVVILYDGYYSCPGSVGKLSNWSHFNDYVGSSVECSANLVRCD